MFSSSATLEGVRAVSPANARSLLEQFDRPRARARPAATADMLERIALDGPGVSAEDAAALRVPTLVVGCPGDLLHPLGFARELAGAIPGAELVETAPIGRGERAREAHEREARAAIGRFLAERLDDGGAGREA